VEDEDQLGWEGWMQKSLPAFRDDDATLIDETELAVAQ
jgi:hypothetical protein